MIGARIEITGQLQVLSPLHIGSGEVDTFETGKDGSANVASIVMAGDRPYIPGSSLKGVLASVCKGTEGAQDLFGYVGQIQHDDDTREVGQAGAAIFWNALMGDAAVPRIDRRTAIDPGTGVAQQARLFATHVIDEGACFDMRLALMTNRPDAEALLIRLLNWMQAPGGIAMGRGTRQGNGRVRLLDKGLAVTLVSPDGRRDLTGDWKGRIRATAPLTSPGERTWRLRLTGTGPFAILDQSARRTDGDKDTAQLAALTRADGKGPRLTGSSLMGALRARFAWYVADRFGEGDDPDRNYGHEDTPDNLTRTQRLFGITGWRGRLSVDLIHADAAAKRVELTSVKLDRFSQAPIDNALFTTEAWIGASFELMFYLRPAIMQQSLPEGETDADILTDFIADLTDPVWGGLEIGHGTNKGFGWFRVEEF